MNTVAILLCAGAGNRMRGKVEDKILADLGDRKVFDYNVIVFEQLEALSSYVVVYRDQGQRIQLEERFSELSKKQKSLIETSIVYLLFFSNKTRGLTLF